MVVKNLVFAMLFFFSVTGVSHATVMLDFDSLITGSDIVNNPLVTVDGIITASATNGNLSITSDPATGFIGDFLLFEEINNSGYAQLGFDYDVNSVSFLFSGVIGGVFSAQALDESLTIVDSFFDVDTFNDLPGGAVTLTGKGIRYFRFSDSPAGGLLAGVDKIIVTAAVPEPTTMLLFGTGLAGLAVVARKKRK